MLISLIPTSMLSGIILYVFIFTKNNTVSQLDLEIVWKVNLTPEGSNRSSYGGSIFLSCSVQSVNSVWLFATPWTAAHQASLSVTNSQSLLKLMSIELVMPSNHLILCRPLLLPSIFPSIRAFPVSQFFTDSHQVAKVLEFQLQHQSFQWLFRNDFL